MGAVKERRMDNNRLHLFVKICMVILLLVLAYVLPGVCARRAF